MLLRTLKVLHPYLAVAVEGKERIPLVTQEAGLVHLTPPAVRAEHQVAVMVVTVQMATYHSAEKAEVVAEEVTAASLAVMAETEVPRVAEVVAAVAGLSLMGTVELVLVAK
jgi:hypothetical protein